MNIQKLLNPDEKAFLSFYDLSNRQKLVVTLKTSSYTMKDEISAQMLSELSDKIWHMTDDEYKEYVVEPVKSARKQRQVI